MRGGLSPRILARANRVSLDGARFERALGMVSKSITTRIPHGEERQSAHRGAAAHTGAALAERGSSLGRGEMPRAFAILYVTAVLQQAVRTKSAIPGEASAVRASGVLRALSL